MKRSLGEAEALQRIKSFNGKIILDGKEITSKEFLSQYASLPEDFSCILDDKKLYFTAEYIESGCFVMRRCFLEEK